MYRQLSCWPITKLILRGKSYKFDSVSALRYRMGYFGCVAKTIRELLARCCLWQVLRCGLDADLMRSMLTYRAG